MLHPYGVERRASRRNHGTTGAAQASTPTGASPLTPARYRLMLRLLIVRPLSRIDEGCASACGARVLTTCSPALCPRAKSRAKTRPEARCCRMRAAVRERGAETEVWSPAAIRNGSAETAAIERRLPPKRAWSDEGSRGGAFSPSRSSRPASSSPSSPLACPRPPRTCRASCPT